MTFISITVQDQKQNLTLCINIEYIAMFSFAAKNLEEFKAEGEMHNVSIFLNGIKMPNDCLTFDINEEDALALLDQTRSNATNAEIKSYLYTKVYKDNGLDGRASEVEELNEDTDVRR